MAVKRPAILSVVGILNIVMGSLGLLGIICCGPLSFVDTQQMMKSIVPKTGAVQGPQLDPAEGLKEVPGYTSFVALGLAMGVVTGSLLVASGTGLLRMRRWGRALGLTYAIVGILWGTGSTVINQKLVAPKLVEGFAKFQEELNKGRINGGPPVPGVPQAIPPNIPDKEPGPPAKPPEIPENKKAAPPAKENSGLSIAYFVVVLIISLTFPVIELILMLLPAVRLGLAGVPDPAWEPDSGGPADAGPDGGDNWGETIRQ